VERVSDGVYRVTVQIVNDGYLPTLSAIGARAGWTRRIRLELDLDGQTVASGRRVQLLGAITGSGGASEASWLIVGRAGSRLTVSAESPVAGSASTTITLQAR